MFDCLDRLFLSQGVFMSALGRVSKTTEPLGGSSCKIFYCNGMTTTREQAEAHAKKIEKLTGIKVELHHNNTTSKDKTVAMGAKLLGGSVLLVYALAAEKKTTYKKIIDSAVGLSGLGLLIWGLHDYYEIQKQKNESAQKLADKVVSYLKKNPRNQATLVFHSQGADIGERALNLLHDYKDRIQVITMGGMVDIPSGAAKRVINFVDENDTVAQAAKATFGELSKAKSSQGKYTSVITRNKDGKTSGCHGASYYLNRSTIRQTMLEFCSPICA